ncbi:hypothetical protein GS534_24310 [Rhodococcus hoagii]|nr:hypothetical protein [Prescottella equi]NKS33154.1 hypothetical protein [Prescottella equi]
MTTIVTTYADLASFPSDELFTLAFGDGTPTHANLYVQDIGAIEGHAPWTWACGADLAQWGSFSRNEYVTRDIALTLRAHENAVIADRGVSYIDNTDGLGLTVDRSAALAQRFDY